MSRIVSLVSIGPRGARLREAWSRHHGLALAVLGGVTFALTSPPTDLYPMVVVGLALLAAALEDAPSAARAFGRAMAWGTAASVVGLRFVPPVIQRFTALGTGAAYLALVLLAAGQSIIWAIGAVITHLARRRAGAPLPLAFGAGVLVTLCLPTIFAWTPAGLVSPWPTFVQLADVVGERGVSVLLAVSAALAARAAREWFAGGRVRAWRLAVGSAGIPLALAAYGALRIRSIAIDGLPEVRVALVDQAVAPLERWDPRNYPAILAKLQALTREAESQGAELTVWPEAAYPYPLGHSARRVSVRGPRGVFGDAAHGPILLGLILEDPPIAFAPGRYERQSYNSATLVTGDGAMQAPYDKLELLWFGETVPLGAQLPWLRRMFQKSGGLVPGTEARALELTRDRGPKVRMGILNCYEDTLPSVGRRIVRALEPNLLVNVTNDAWFFGTAEPELHARLGAMRAIEHRRDLVRAVNMGVASWIDARGVVRAREGGGGGVLMATPAVRDGSITFYAKVGDTPAFALLLASILGVALRRRGARQT